MTYFDIFNGDADGLCALHQLRLSEPRPSVLITGVKRDTELVELADVKPGDHLTVLDIGMDRNNAALERALAAGASCLYFDHHAYRHLPSHPRLETHIRVEPQVCTSLLVDEYLNGMFPLWAITAAFGDGLTPVARERCQALGLSQVDIQLLSDLGECLNYNAYGDVVSDLYFAPDQLYLRLRPYADPREFARQDAAFASLREGYVHDLEAASTLAPLLATPTHYAVALPTESWSRRINGVLASRLAQEHPRRAHAVLVPHAEGYRVSVRAPQLNPRGADSFCAGFPGGGGRPGAAGINQLPRADLRRFLQAFEAAFPPTSPP